jgi:hypothetical protein
LINRDEPVGFKPEVGVAALKGDGHRRAPESLFTDNDTFTRWPNTVARSRGGAQGHASYTFRRLWAAADATWYNGGGASVDGGEPTGSMNNTRLGATVSFPMSRQQSLKFSYSSGLAVRTGTNFRTISVGWQWLRFTRR